MLETGAADWLLEIVSEPIPIKSSIAEVARDISETSALATELETDDFDSEFEKNLFNLQDKINIDKVKTISMGGLILKF